MGWVPPPPPPHGSSRAEWEQHLAQLQRGVDRHRAATVILKVLGLVGLAWVFALLVLSS